MHLTPSDPDISTIKRRIDNKRLDLQPDFQRGEVWGKQKKQRLIDSILRGWHIPPIHVIHIPNSEKHEVLDGQQRLAAIRDFIDNEFPIFGWQEPIEAEIVELDGLYWNDLTIEARSRIEDFTIRILTISDYKIGEPGELFYRLNQPTNLTSAEQRNAYFGEARQQVKDLVEQAILFGFSRDSIGFSNSRMSYDDVFAKCLLTIEQGALSTKTTSSSVTARYRKSLGFSNRHIESVYSAIELINSSITLRREKTKLNKATLFSWIVFFFEISSNQNINKEIIYEFFDKFETLKELNPKDAEYNSLVPEELTPSFVHKLIVIYNDRASSRVANTSSIKLRDSVLWILFLMYFKNIEFGNGIIDGIAANIIFLDTHEFDEKVLLDFLPNWEGLFI